MQTQKWSINIKNKIKKKKICDSNRKNILILHALKECRWHCLFCLLFFRTARNFVETVPFHEISTPWSQVKLRYFLQWMLTTFSQISDFHWLSIDFHCTEKWSFSLRNSSGNVTKSAVSCGFGHIYWGNT